MEIKIVEHKSYTTLQPNGDLDANSSVILDEKIRGLVEGGTYRIHVDCQGIPYMSSAGLGVFISYLDEIKSKEGKIVLSSLKANVLDVFELLGLHQLIPLATTQEEVEKLFSA